MKASFPWILQWKKETQRGDKFSSFDKVSHCSTEEKKELRIQLLGHYNSDTLSQILAWCDSLTLTVYPGELFWLPIADSVTKMEFYGLGMIFTLFWKQEDSVWSGASWYNCIDDDEEEEDGM